MNLLWVALGGATGAMLRYLLSTALAASRMPLATALANTTGSLLLGVFMAWWLPRSSSVGEPLRMYVAVGLCGGYTTFSTFSYDTLVLMSGGRWGAAGLNLIVNVLGALVAVFAGWWLGRNLFGGPGPV